MSSVRILITAAVLLLTASSADALSKVTVPKGVESRAAALARHAGPKVRAFVAKEGAELAGSRSPSVAAVRAAIQRANLGKLTNAQADALCFLVLAQATDDQMRTVQAAIAAEKSSSAPAPRPISRFTVDGLTEGHWSAAAADAGRQAIAASKTGADRLTAEQAMSQLDLLEQALSSMLQAISDTDEAIVQNLK